MTQTIDVLVDAGKATGGAPLGPALGPLGVNVADIVNAINEKTKAYEGMKVPVKLVVDETTKKYEISVGTPPTTALILKELGVEKGSGMQRETKAGDLKFEQVVKIAKAKGDSLAGKGVKEKAQAVIGTCQSMGVTIDGKEPKEAHKLVTIGKYDKFLKE